MSNHLQAPLPQQLARSAADRRIAGVASGMAYYFGIDPILMRLAFIGLVFTGGIGLLLYPIMWFVMPRENAGPPQAWSQSYGQPQVQQVSQQAASGVMPSAGARFDPMTGRPLKTEAPRFDPYTGQPLPADETLISITNAAASGPVVAASRERRKRALALVVLGLSVIAFSQAFWFAAALLVPVALMGFGVMLLRSS